MLGTRFILSCPCLSCINDSALFSEDPFLAFHKFLVNFICTYLDLCSFAFCKLLLDLIYALFICLQLWWENHDCEITAEVEPWEFSGLPSFISFLFHIPVLLRHMYLNFIWKMLKKKFLKLFAGNWLSCSLVSFDCHLGLNILLHLTPVLRTLAWFS